MEWDKHYRQKQRIWGDGPSELAAIAAGYLQSVEQQPAHWNILDVGCGYGRDAFHLARQLDSAVLGIDISSEAIRLAQEGCQRENVTFRCCELEEVAAGAHDVILVSNLYHLLRREAREVLVQAIERALGPDGWLFLNTLSPRDPQHYGQGTPVPDDPGAFENGLYMKFCTRDELTSAFDFVEIEELYAHAYTEHLASGDVHHHVSWILIGRLAS